MNASDLSLDAKAQRDLAVDLFNLTWQLIDKPDRICEENELMLHRAHASRLHWEYVGGDQERAVGEWQVSRVHALVGHADAALYHGQRSLFYAQRGQTGPFYEAFAHEAIARAYALVPDARATEHLRLARDLASKITDEDERKLLLPDLDFVAAL